MPLWNKFMRSPLSSTASKSSLHLPQDTRGTQVYPESPSKAQATSSELHIEQQTRVRHLRSTPSHLSKTVKPASNLSVDSFYTADGDQDHSSDSSQPTHVDEDITQTTLPEKEDTAKTFADRAWTEDPTFIDREKFVEWLGSPSEIRQQALTHYIANFDFVGINIDEAIRRLCQKLYLKGETQQIDRVLESFSEQYIEQNPNSIWRYVGVVHVVTFAIILLNTDLQASELQTHITSSRFVDNTIEVVRSQLREPSLSPTHEKLAAPEHLPDIQESGAQTSEPPCTPVLSRMSSPPHIERRASNARDRLNSVGSTSFNRDSWVLPGHNDTRDSYMEPMDIERFIAEATRELSAIYHNVRNRPILQPKPDDTPASPQSKIGGGFLKRGSNRLHNSLRGESPYAQSSGSPSGASFVSIFGHRVSSSMSSLPQFLGITSSPSLPSSTNADLAKSADTPFVKTGPLLWKSMKPTPGRIAKPKRWVNVIATTRSSVFDMCSPSPSGANAGAGRRIGGLSLLHALAQEIPPARSSKVRSFGLTVASGETHVFEIQAASTGTVSSGLFKSKSKLPAESDAEVLSWVRACNYYAARYSRAPLPDAVTNVEYGWNGAIIANEDDNQSIVSAKIRNVLIDDWVAPTTPMNESQLSVEDQLESWNHQVKACNEEFAEHGEMRGRMMNLYRSGSVQAQKALSNWEKKAQHLLTEIVRFETYVEILKNAEPEPEQS